MLITGGAGMIGSTIAHLAVAQGAQVSILDAMLPLYGGNRFNLQGILDKIQFIEGDIRDLDLMRRVVPGYDYIFNLAGQVSYVDSNTDPLLDLDINCKGHLQVLEACRRRTPGPGCSLPVPALSMGGSNITRWTKTTRLTA